MKTTEGQTNKIKQLLFPETTNRLQHLIRTVAHLVLALLILGLEFEILTWLQLDPDKTTSEVVLDITSLAFAVYYAVGNLLPRIRSIGWKPVTLLILIIPVLGLFFWLALFFIRPKTDYFEPVPAVLCPSCRTELRGWQGKKEGCNQFLWRQGEAAPVSHMVDERWKWSRERLDGVRLPTQEFQIYASCVCSRRALADCSCTNSVWTETRLHADERDKNTA